LVWFVVIWYIFPLLVFCSKKNLAALVKTVRFFSGGKEGGDEEPDKMAIAFGRIGRFKAWIRNGVVGFFRGIKNRLLRLVRGGNGRGNEIQLEVTEENDFQVNPQKPEAHS
jgi:hypothetical protein